MIKWDDDQLRAIKESGNLLVSASAGSGKTSVMIERIMRLIKSGTDLRKLLVITFTRTAAADIKEKIIDSLYEEMRERPSTLIKHQMHALPFCNISTIDSFCADIYRNFYAEAGLEPGLKVVEQDDNEASPLFGEAVDEVLEECLRENSASFINMLEKLTEKRSTAMLKSELLKLNSRLAVLLDKQSFLSLNQQIFEDKAKEYVLSYFCRQLARVKSVGDSALAAAKALKVREDYLEHTLYLLDHLGSIMALRSFSDFLEYDFTIGINKTPQRKKKSDTIADISFRDNYLDGFSSLFSGMYKTINEFLDAFRQVNEDKQILDEFLLVLKRADKRYTEKKLAQGYMDFADLSIYAAKILEDDERAKRVSDQYDYIFVDEYQDTSPIQEHIIGRIQKVGNLFMVGDVKQSIYGFRDAEPVIFINRRKQYESTKLGLNVPMNANFRSNTGIIDFVNAFFVPLMSEYFGGVDYRGDAQLKKGIEMQPLALPACQFTLFPKLEKPHRNLPKIYSVAADNLEGEQDTREAVHIAETIRSLVGIEEIYDAKLKQTRLIEYSDIAILMRKRNDKGILQTLSKYCIPYKSENFEKEQHYELDDLVNYLKIINNFNDDIALAGAMQSFIGGFTHNEMLAIRTSGSYDYFYENVLNYPKNGNLYDKITAFLQQLEIFRNKSYVTSVAGLLIEIMASSGLDAFVMSKDNGSSEIEYINTFILNLSTKEYATDIPSFLRYYQDIYKGGCSSYKVSDAVRVMTIHASKGLEFPIVIAAHFDTSFKGGNRGRDNILFDRDLGIAIKEFSEDTLTKVDSFRMKVIKLKEKNRGREEELRIIYVALTRAKNHLFITGNQSQSKSAHPDEMDNPVQWLNYSIKHQPTLAALEAPPKKSTLVEERTIAKPDYPSILPELDALDYSYPYIESTNNALKYSVSRINKWAQVENEASYINGVSFDKEVGTAYHTVLEKIDFEATDIDKIAQEVSNLQKVGLIAQEQNIDLQLIASILTSTLWDKVRAGKYFREWPFMLYIPHKEVIESSTINDKVLVQGVCDLVVLGEENFIIDYKVTNMDTQSIISRYQKQLELYSLAVNKIKQVPIHKKIIYVINRNEAIYLD